MRVLFVLTITLLLGIPFSLRASDDAPTLPEQKEDAFASPLSPDKAFSDLMRNILEEHLDRFQQRLNNQQNTEERLDKAIARIEEQTDRSISLINAGFTALGVCAGILALLGISSVAYSIVSAKRTIKDMKEKQKEAEAIINHARETDQTLSAILSKHQPSEQFTPDVLAKAHESTKTGTGLDVLRAIAVLAQEEKQWKDALTYWKGVLRASPEDTNALFGASLAALNLSKEAKREEQGKYFSLAEEYFQKFPQAQLTYAVLNNWGNLYAIRAESEATPEARNSLFAQAEKKYKRAVSIDPEKFKLWSNWGNLYTAWGKSEDTPEARNRRFAQAEEKFKHAVSIDPDDYDTWHNWGNLYLAWGKSEDTPEARNRRFAQAEEKFRQAVSIAPDDYDTWHNWGVLCVTRAESEDTPEVRNSLFAQAEEKYKRAVSIDPEKFELWFNGGNLYTVCGKSEDTLEARNSLFAQAEEKFRQAVSIAPDDYDTWHNWGVLCVTRAESEDNPEARNSLFAQAEEKYNKAVKLDPTVASAWFNRACLESLRGNIQNCVAYLEKWHEYDSDASADKLDGDKDFDAVRNTPEFKAFRKKMLKQTTESSDSE